MADKGTGEEYEEKSGAIDISAPKATPNRGLKF